MKRHLFWIWLVEVELPALQRLLDFRVNLFW